MKKSEKEDSKEIIEAKEIETEKKECFVIMPIGDHPSHSKGHFKRVYEDILKPAIISAGFEPFRADDGGGSQNIQIDIIKKIIEAPMAICDLSTRNPNVLFELGVRQAFDMPVALIQEEGTERIFDINTFNTLDYRSQRIYHEVMEDRRIIERLISETYRKHNEGDGVNSIIRLIPSVNPAKIKSEEMRSDELIKVIYNQLNALTGEVRNIKMNSSTSKNVLNDYEFDNKYYSILAEYDNLIDEDLDNPLIRDQLNILQFEIRQFLESHLNTLLDSEKFSKLRKLERLLDRIPN